jgi:large subunit ribosomal protein L2
MAVKTFKPITPTLRFKTVADFSVLTKKSELPSRPKKLTQSKTKSGGRNMYGRITTQQIGGGHKQKYRVIDFKREKANVPGKVASIEYDPNRTAWIALINYIDGDKRFIVASEGLKVGDPVIASDQADIKPSNHLTLSFIPVGTFIHNIEVLPGKGGKLSRSAGSYGQLVSKEADYCQVRMPSGEIRLIKTECKASIGQVSNQEHENVTIGKAGRSRWMGIRPTVRGVAKNPVDHPMGGGEGKSSGGRHPTTPWGKPTKGYKTRKNKRTDVFMVKRIN